ncbi:hypothetical protein C7I85_20635 [Mesorhizobium soli]|uniref:Uncharacterized protein n=2 Tax=Pseudaminobacter soli (ex Li et al. 2025) TaxID=1295366 RepID=A0A2P7S717_9HYPH|nr:hypothetical protein C7I85_20635 [Mesorhizobium soli]
MNLIGVAISSAFAAYFGAWGAQKLILRAQEVSEIRATSNLISSSQIFGYTILNAALIFKKQHGVELKEKYEQDLRSGSNIGGANIVHLRMDLRTLPLPRFPLNQAETLFFEKVQLSGRAAAAAATVLQSIELLREAVELRNSLIEEIRHSSLSEPEKIAIYLALPTPKGHDERYKNVVDAISSYCDDVIFFALILDFDLQKKNNDLLLISRKAQKLTRPAATKWRHEIIDRLVPSPDYYREWLDGYPDDEIPPILTLRKSSDAT